MRSTERPPRIVYTVGHSNRALVELVDLLREQRVELLVDVRRHPGSRRHPHFAREQLRAGLTEAGIAYRHEADLGGRRDSRPESSNAGLRNVGLRAYADHMATALFAAAFERLVTGAGRPTAILCAEADPYHCHRQLLADALVLRGIEVLHILEPGRCAAHEVHLSARLDECGRLTYPARAPAGDGTQLDLF